MATLIGDGGHATDIWPTIPDRKKWARCAHHKDFELVKHTEPVIIGINDPQVRAQVAEELDIEDLSWKHPTAWIGPDCTFGYGSHVGYMASMTRTHMGNHCTVAPGATICGDVFIGDRVFIGAGAVIKNLVTIGDDAFIRMGALVVRDVRAGERY